jgi:vacuolar protein sorting-associated protein 16
MNSTSELAIERKSMNPFDDDSSSVNSEDDDVQGSQNEVVQNDMLAESLSSSPSSWQYLGDLPYRRVKIYEHVLWGHTKADEERKHSNNDNRNPIQQGLAYISQLSQKHKKPSQLSSVEYLQFIASTTQTLIASCSNGGAVATVTVPLASSSTVQSEMSTTLIRIMSCAGQIISTIPFPPPSLKARISSEILAIGFTSRCTLIVVLQDSTCLTYTLSGKPVLPPFYILNDANNKRSSGMAMDLIEVSIYEGGVAVLAANMSCALVEILDSKEQGDETYLSTAHIASRIVRSSEWDSIESSHDIESYVDNHQFFPLVDDNTVTNYALITPLATASFAKTNLVSYTSVAVLPRIHTQSRHPEVFLGTSNHSVIVCDVSRDAIGRMGEGITDVNCQGRISSPIIRMKFAPNGRFLACFTEGSIMTVISTSFETKVLDFDTSDGSSDLPISMEWCGEDSVVLHWKNLGVLMVGPYGDWIRFPYNGIQNLFLCPEMDCCRVITDESVEILQRVPPATAAMMQIGSIEPAAMLLDASDAFHNGSPASDEAARAITKSGLLAEAIEVCIDAASKEFDVHTQKRLLKAASYGMHFDYKDGSTKGILGGKVSKSLSGECVVTPSGLALEFVRIAKKIRVLNALRDPSIGVVLTSAQYDSIDANGIVARLIAMKRPALAATLSTYLQLDHSVRAYARAARASAFVSTDLGRTDSETAKEAIEILNTNVSSPFMNRGGYATVALAANKVGRQGVANHLLSLETSVSDKVPALAMIGQYSDAAAVAVKAKDDDLIFHVLVEFEAECIKNNPDATEAQRSYLNTIVNKFPPEALRLVSKYFNSMNDTKHAINLHLKARHFSTAGSIVATRAIDLPREQDMLVSLQEASRLYGVGKDTAFEKSCTDDYIQLILEQEVSASV